MSDDATQGPVDPGPAADVIDEEAVEAELLEADLRDLAAERDELRGAAQRIQADFENYRKRVMRDQAALSQRATEQLVEAMLPALDAFEMAVVSLGDADEKVRKGVELAVGELNGVLERQGLARIAELDVEFDPNLHEAVMQDDGDGEPRVGDVLRTGYALNGRVLRPAMVKVTRSDAALGERPGEANG
ncbi:MAG TPA: nucleotide exchange factor GrpE [Acidimicrobiia bacterium]|jgi:molecular chaperone GrpE|nr:nucleotide exchange factor GrpE [Acidimicrobiia bacterium]